MKKDNIRAEPSLSEVFRTFEKSLGFKNDIKWPSCIAITLYHIVGIYWCYYFALPVKWQTVMFGKNDNYLFLWTFEINGSLAVVFIVPI